MLAKHLFLHDSEIGAATQTDPRLNVERIQMNLPDGTNGWPGLRPGEKCHPDMGAIAEMFADEWEA